MCVQTPEGSTAMIFWNQWPTPLRHGSIKKYRCYPADKTNRGDLDEKGIGDSGGGCRRQRNDDD
jgi:hypothetical protein